MAGILVSDALVLTAMAMPSAARRAGINSSMGSRRSRFRSPQPRMVSPMAPRTRATRTRIPGTRSKTTMLAATRHPTDSTRMAPHQEGCGCVSPAGCGAGPGILDSSGA